jgi:hypothetical protein
MREGPQSQWTAGRPIAADDGGARCITAGGYVRSDMPENEPATQERPDEDAALKPGYDPFDADRWAECVDPDDSDYLEGTAMSRD